jgi:hypothetical protein
MALQIYRTTGRTSPVMEAKIAARIDPAPANVERAVAEARAMFARTGDLSFYVQVMAELGREEEVYATLAKLTKPLPQDNTFVYFAPWLKRFRADPRFMLLARRLGFTDYWTQSGKWPDFCFEPGFPYDCKAEAAKLPPKSAIERS